MGSRMNDSIPAAYKRKSEIGLSEIRINVCCKVPPSCYALTVVLFGSLHGCTGERGFEYAHETRHCLAVRSRFDCALRGVC